jgi:hypothetical protein
VRTFIPFFRRVREAVRKHDAFELAFELFVVVLGVFLGLAASNWSAARHDREYRAQMISALNEALTDYVDSGHHIHREILGVINNYDRLVSEGKRPPPPFLRFPLLDRPPTRTWDALVATGLARSLSPKLVFRLAMHFSNADSFGDRYQRYNEFTEQEILPYESHPEHFYDPDGKLSMPYVQHIGRLREILALNDEMTDDAKSMQQELNAEH